MDVYRRCGDVDTMLGSISDGDEIQIDNRTIVVLEDGKLYVKKLNVVERDRI